MTKSYSTGYWGVPGTSHVTLTCIAVVDHEARSLKRLCGKPINPKAEYLWCASHAETRYVSCDECRKKWEAMRQAYLEKLTSKVSLHVYGKPVSTRVTFNNGGFVERRGRLSVREANRMRDDFIDASLDRWVESAQIPDGNDGK